MAVMAKELQPPAATATTGVAAAQPTASTSAAAAATTTNLPSLPIIRKAVVAEASRRAVVANVATGQPATVAFQPPATEGVTGVQPAAGTSGGGGSGGRGGVFRRQQLKEINALVYDQIKNSVVFFVTWVGPEEETGIVSSQTALELFPKEALRFYEKRILDLNSVDRDLHGTTMRYSQTFL